VIAACRAAGLPVTVVPGPSAATTAVALAGAGGGGFMFEGFLPRKSGARRRRLAELAALRSTLVIYESPHRLIRLLTELDAALGARRVHVAREMTKKFEECQSGTPAELLLRLAARPVKGEVTVVVQAPD
jgi:16S rRNA (cytidine1402-2'-O)-methyltransferase